MKWRALPWKQILLLTLWSFACVAPLMAAKGLNIVSEVFLLGAQRFWHGENPYTAPVQGDVFHYSPFFAMVYSLALVLPTKVHVLLFALLNSFVFWLGVSCWFRLEKKQSWRVWVGLIFCAMELDISLRYQQTNALTFGLVLTALFAFRERCVAWAASLFALVVNIKIFPIIFPSVLALRPVDKKYIGVFLAASAALVLLPCLVVGLKGGWQLHYDQLHAISSDLPSRHLQDLRSMLTRWNLPWLGEILRYVVVITALLLFPVSYLFTPREQFGWEEWALFAVTSILLFIPRAESPTFVLMAPAYVFLTRKHGARIGAVVLLAGFVGTFIFTSAWPAHWFAFLRAHWSGKTIGAFMLWCVCTGLLISKLKCSLCTSKSE